MNYTASEGKQWVLTQEGYDNTPNKIKPERAVGKPIKGYEECVPRLWVEKGWVEEVRHD